MKKGSLFMILILLSTIIFAQSKNDYLKQVLNNLNQIKSATYIRYMESTAPYDTVLSQSCYTYVKEYINPTDTFVGANYAEFLLKDSTKMDYFYDGKVKGYINWDNNTISVDSFQNNKLPFRIVYPPFFTHVKSLIRYALETKDSLTVELNDLVDSVQISLFVKYKIAEVVGNRIVYGSDPNIDEKYTQYDIWINKATGLPTHLRKENSMFTSWERTKNVNVNKTNIELFIASKYFPPDFVIAPKNNAKSNISDLVGKKAPDWSLKSADNESIALKDLKSKVLMLQFTGIGCGPCLNSIPFIKQLVVDYKNKNFEFVSIETWTKDLEVIKSYKEKNSFNFKFLKSEMDVTKDDYNVVGVPVFFILDENRIIRKVISGYGKGTTDKEIRDAIDNLL